MSMAMAMIMLIIMSVLNARNHDHDFTLERGRFKKVIFYSLGPCNCNPDHYLSGVDSAKRRYGEIMSYFYSKSE